MNTSSLATSILTKGALRPAPLVHHFDQGSDHVSKRGNGGEPGPGPAAATATAASRAAAGGGPGTKGALAAGVCGRRPAPPTVTAYSDAAPCVPPAPPSVPAPPDLGLVYIFRGGPGLGPGLPGSGLGLLRGHSGLSLGPWPDSPRLT